MLSACNYSMKTISLARRTLPTLGAIPTTTSTRGYSTARHGYQPGEARPERSILITGALGQLGMEIAAKLRSMYGSGSVLVTDIRKASDDVYNAGPYRYLDVLDQKRMEKIVVEHNVDSIVHLSCLLSAIGEKQVDKALMVNNGGTENVLAVAKQHGLSVFCPRYCALNHSSCCVFASTLNFYNGLSDCYVVRASSRVFVSQDTCIICMSCD
eukprot:m.1379373 g.1379373  ORF g.1379373 m.1379373 type:complete len:212 (+) comp24965_c1_seq1:279-914(+)